MNLSSALPVPAFSRLCIEHRNEYCFPSSFIPTELLSLDFSHDTILEPFLVLLVQAMSPAHLWEESAVFPLCALLSVLAAVKEAIPPGESLTLRTPNCCSPI